MFLKSNPARPPNLVSVFYGVTKWLGTWSGRSDKLLSGITPLPPLYSGNLRRPIDWVCLELETEREVPFS